MQVGLLTAQNKTNHTIEGKVSDASGNPIAYASVVLKGTNHGAVSDDGGEFVIRAPSGHYTLRVSFIGYTTYQAPITIKEEGNALVEVVLKEDNTKLEEVTVVGKTQAQRLEESARAVGIIETREVKLRSADLGEILAKTEGISVQRAGGLGSDTRFALNGLSGDKIRFFHDGIPLDFSPYAFGIANVPVNAIKQVEVHKGVVPIQFGADALGGAVNLVSPTIFNGWSGAASYQVGSFNTHRATANMAYASDQSGWFASAGGFYDYTDNDYKIDVAIDDEQGQLHQQTVKRFHDGYKAVGFNFKTGIRHKSWANELSLEGYYGKYDKEVQNSQSPGLVDYPDLGIDKAVAGKPFGEVMFNRFSQGLNLHYNVNPAVKWELDLKAGYNYNEAESFDVSHNLYNWYGEVVRVNNQAGEFGQADHLITKSTNYFARQQLGYSISDKHNLTLTLAPTYAHRTGDDLLIDGEYDPALDDGYLFDFVTGLEYSGEVLRERLQIIVFAKNYRQNIRIEGIDPGVEGLQVDKRSVNNFGAGTGLRYAWTSRFSTKLSYEYAYRLPRQNEIFGNGQLTSKNLGLRPENSHNVNLQWLVESKILAKTAWQIQGNFFLRKVNDLIFLMTNSEGFGVYDNVWSATSQGIELGANIKEVVKGLSLSANGTYQSYFNTSDEGPFASFKDDRIPNTPYLFANGGAYYQLKNMVRTNGELSIFWNTRYVHPFYIGWESAGLPQYKAQTPKQFTHAIGATQKMKFKTVETALTLEMQNLTNAKVFDLYGVQRPGRALYLKLTTQF
ncbi:TonB-dependent receptor [Sinomicrobium soli]|uniref:TonB-dependent receptor n=1 Tax=Sinomicrobium sp. N-1-3-6 TaxID=2219864 RepID=UPI0011BF761C|nr:TonB-dependent receptor [Sinomicrobium sp. N-1-3-6]